MPYRKNASNCFIQFASDVTRIKLDVELFQKLKTYLPNQIYLNINCAAIYLCFSTKTLASWRSNNRHQLPFLKKGKDIHYLLSDLNLFIEKYASQSLTGSQEYKSLLDRKSAAKQINSTAGTLAVWVTQKNPDLTFIKIGRAVRYRPYDLYIFNLERLRTKKLC
ncbi:hypothetical protein [Emticicia fontis]